MTERSLVVKLRAELADFKRNFAAAGAEVNEFTKDLDKASKAAKKTGDQADATAKTANTALGQMAQSASKHEKEWTQVGTALVAVGAAAAAGVGLAVAKFADFDESMSKAAAGTQATGASLNDLRLAAIDAGAQTMFSATEAAQAVTEMGKAGVSTADILGGGLTGALALAAAGELEVGRAGEIAATAMTQFKMSGKDLPHIADLLAAGAGKAQGGVNDLADAMKYVGPVASGLGVSIEETTGTLALFAKQGTIGGSAGEALRGILLSLTSPSQAAAEKMAELGISVYDAGGQFIGLEGVAGVLQSKLGVLDEATRNQALGQIFSNAQVTNARMLYDGGAKAVAHWTSEVDDAGFAADQAAALTDNLKGDVERLGGSLDTALIQTGSAANTSLRALAQAAEDAVNAFSSLPGPMQTTAIGATAVIGAASLLGGGFLLLAPRIVETRKALDVLSTSMPRLVATMRALKAAALPLGGVLAAGVIGFTLWANAQKEARARTQELADALDQQNGALTENSTAWIQAELTKDQSFGIKNTQSMIEAAEEMGISVETLTRAYQGQPAAMLEAKNAAQQYSDTNFSLSQAQQGLARTFIENIDEQGVRLTEAQKIVAAKALIDAEAAAEQEGLTGALGTTTEAVGEQTAAVEEVSEAQLKWREEMAGLDAGFVNLGGALDTIIQKNRDVAEATADQTESTKDSWEDFYDGFSFSVDKYLAELQKQVDAQAAWEKNMLLLSGRVSQGTLDELARMGPEGAPLVAKLVTSSDKELAKFEGLVAQRTGDATNKWVTTLEDSGPLIAWASAKLGKKAADEIATKLRDGTKTVAQIMAGYGMAISSIRPGVVVTLKTWQAEQRLLAFKEALKRDDFVITAEVRKEGGYYAGRATGGPIVGPGTGTSDDVPILASNGEHMLTDSDVRKAGGHAGVYRLREWIQAGALRFAGGGAVGSSPLIGHVRGRVAVNTLSPFDPMGGAIAGGGNVRTLVAFGRWLQVRNFSVGEHPLFGGVHGGHMVGSKHYSGKAIDVNAGAGTSLAEQRRLASIVGEAHARGLRTLFMVPGHKGHLHAEVPYLNGGYTGEAGGRVHPREYVVKASSTAKYGTRFLDALNAGQFNINQAPAPAAPAGAQGQFRDLILNEITDMDGTARAVTRRLAMVGKA